MTIELGNDIAEAAAKMAKPPRRRRPKVNLGGVAEISEKYGVPRTTISMWDVHERHGWPKPLERLRSGPVYDMDEVEAWFCARRENPPGS